VPAAPSPTPAAVSFSATGRPDLPSKPLGDDLVSIGWTGCYVHNGPDLDVQGDRVHADSTTACAWACNGYSHMVLEGRHWCSCRNKLPPASQFTRVLDTLCGEVCAGEAGLSPARYCGGPSTFATYSLLRLSPAIFTQAERGG